MLSGNRCRKASDADPQTGQICMAISGPLSITVPSCLEFNYTLSKDLDRDRCMYVYDDLWFCPE